MGLVFDWFPTSCLTDLDALEVPAKPAAPFLGIPGQTGLARDDNLVMPRERGTRLPRNRTKIVQEVPKNCPKRSELIRKYPNTILANIPDILSKMLSRLPSA